MTFTLHMIDVFSAGPLSGNPLAVVTGADNLTTDDMQRLTRWFNLSETTFLLPPTHPKADYRVRIFSLDRSCPLPGTPHWAAAMPGSPPRVRQKRNGNRAGMRCGAGHDPE